MPGPFASWAAIDPKERIITIELLQNFLQSQIVKRESLDVPFVVSSQEARIDEAVEKPAAVLVPLITIDEITIDSILVTTRTMSVNSHKGQVSFPGGRIEEIDKDNVQTALRETQEEVGLVPGIFKVLGESNIAQTRSRSSSITPIVAVANAADIPKDFEENEEVQSVHIIKLEQLLKPDNYSSEIWDFGETSPTIHIYRVFDDQDKPVFIWGATAHMITDLLHCLSGV